VTHGKGDGLESWTYYVGWNLVFFFGATVPLRISPIPLQDALARAGYGVMAVSVLAVSTLHNLYGFDGSTRTAFVHWSLGHGWAVTPVVVLVASSHGFAVADTAGFLGGIAASTVVFYQSMTRVEWVRRLFE
jgi:hypothetical protein